MDWMIDMNDQPLRMAERKRLMVRSVILDTAEKLIESNDPADFSMRQLCEQAGVSFTTPFNYFGSKNGITHELALRIFIQINERFEASCQRSDAVERVFAMSGIGSSVWLEHPRRNRFVSASLIVGEDQKKHEFLARSEGLWAKALADGVGFDPATRVMALEVLPITFAIAFRGVMALWIADEIDDNSFASLINLQLATLLIAFVPSERKADLASKVAALSDERNRSKGTPGKSDLNIAF